MFATPVGSRRSRLSLAVSLVLHAGLIVAVVVAAGLVAARPPVSSPASLAFVAALASPTVIAELTAPQPLEPLALPEPDPEPVMVPDLEDPALELFVPAPPEPEPAPEPARAPEARPEPVAPQPPPSIELGLFGGGRQVAEVARAGEIRAAGFELEAAAAPRVVERTTEVGVLDAPSEAPRPGAERLATVTSAGFGGPQRSEAAAARPQPGVVTGLAGFGGGEGTAVATRATREVVTGVAGFGATPAPEPEPAAPAAVAASGFQTEPPAPAREARAHAGPPDTPVEVTYKPTPEYSPEARAAGVEGDVALEVEFTGGGEVRVLRVVEGLGHGLDERAVRAAEQMRFTPAVRDGQRVSTRAIVYIVFRLT